MTFLIIHAQKFSAQKDILVKFFKSKKISCRIFPLTKDSELPLNSIPQKFKGITHAVLLDELPKGQNTLFALGLLLGMGIKTYALKSAFASSVKNCGALKEFAGFEKLSAFLEKNIASIAADEKQRAAYEKLFETGNPYTGDSMALHVEKDRREIIQTYIDAGLDLNTRTSTGTPMLNVAIRAEQVELVKWMLEDKSLNLDAVSKDRGYSALMDCVWKKNIELTKILIGRGVNLNFVSTDNQSALVLAVGEGNAAMVTLLAEAGADVDKTDALGMSALTYARLFKRDDLVAVLEKYHHEK